MMTFLWIAFSFLIGSLPFSVWLGRLADTDPRAIGMMGLRLREGWTLALSLLALLAAILFGGWRLPDHGRRERKQSACPPLLP